MATTSDYLTQLQVDKSNLIAQIRAKGVEVEDNATFTDLPSKVTDIKSGTKSNIYKKSSIEEMEALTNLDEGDICLVYKRIIKNMEETDTPSVLMFPKQVILSEVFTGMAYASLRPGTGWSPNVWVMIRPTATLISISIENSGNWRYVEYEYTSSDGITYVRTDENDDVINLGTEVIFDAEMEPWNNTIGYFIQLESLQMDGLFEYKENSWDYLDIGAVTSPDYIYQGKRVYTNNGLIAGTLCDEFSTAFNDGGMQVYSKLRELIDCTEPLVLTDTTSLLEDIICIPSRSDGNSLIDCSNLTSIDNLFKNCNKVERIQGDIKIENATSAVNTFNSCYKLVELPKLDTSNVVDMRGMFSSCGNLTLIPQIDTSNVVDMSDMFNSCSSLTTIPQIDTSNVTNMYCMFINCESLVSLPQLNTRNVTNTVCMFQNCLSLTTLPQLDMSHATRVDSMFLNCDSLADLGGFKDLGKACLTSSGAYCNLDLSVSTNLTEQSIINVLNNLYNVASEEYNPQTIQFGSTNLAKLTSEEGQKALESATSKGWTIS